MLVDRKLCSNNCAAKLVDVACHVTSFGGPLSVCPLKALGEVSGDKFMQHKKYISEVITLKCRQSQGKAIRSKKLIKQVPKH